MARVQMSYMYGALRSGKLMAGVLDLESQNQNSTNPNGTSQNLCRRWLI